MHEGVPTYSYYYRWSLIAPALFLSVVLAFVAVALVLVAGPFRRLAHRYKESLLFRIMRDILMRTNTFLLVEFERREAQKEVTEQKESFDGGEAGDVNLTRKVTTRTYYLYNVEVKKIFIHLLFLILVLMILTSAVTFFSTFLTETAFSCEENFDCFLMTEDDEYSNTRLEDCGNYSFNEIICFRLAYKYSEGLGEAGGFLFVMQVLVCFLSWLSVRVGSKAGKYCSLWVTVGLSLIVSIAFVFTIILLPFFVTLERPDVYDTFRTPQRQLQLFIYAYANVVLSVIPPVGAYSAYRREDESENNTFIMYIGENSPIHNAEPYKNPLFVEDD